MNKMKTRIYWSVKIKKLKIKLKTNNKDYTAAYLIYNLINSFKFGLKHLVTRNLKKEYLKNDFSIIFVRIFNK